MIGCDSWEMISDDGSNHFHRSLFLKPSDLHPVHEKSLGEPFCAQNPAGEKKSQHTVLQVCCVFDVSYERE